MSKTQNTPISVVPAGGYQRRKSEAGFGMLEVLISLLILAIGLLGLASLQTTTLAQTTEVRNRSQAILLVDDLLERVRANRSNIASYEVAAGNLPDCATDFAIENNGVAADDLAEWKNSLACLLPGGNGSVTEDNGVVTVQVVWSGNAAGISLEARP